MPKYTVIVTSDATVSTVVDVEASSPAEARQKALDDACDNPGHFDWRLDDGNNIAPYLGDDSDENAVLVD